MSPKERGGRDGTDRLRNRDSDHGGSATKDTATYKKADPFADVSWDDAHNDTDSRCVLNSSFKLEPITDHYIYEDGQGEPYYIVCRTPSKQFPVQQPNGAWGWNKGQRRVLYRLPEVIDAIKARATIRVVEGEKDVHAIEDAGGVATCFPGGGKGTAKTLDALDVLGRYGGADEVIVWQDKDDTGRDRAANTIARLVGKVERVRLVEAKEGKDAADHLDAGYSLDEAVELSLPNLDPDASHGSQERLDVSLDKLDDVSGYEDQFYARCPAHDDNKPSLQIKRGGLDGFPVFDCRAGCTEDWDTFREVLLERGIPDWALRESGPSADRLDAEVKQELHKLKVRAMARDLLDAERALAAFEFPPSERTLADDLAQDLPPLEYTIEELHPSGANSLLGAAFKVGKTTLLANLALALCDGEPFLGRYPVKAVDGRVAFLNYELDARQFLTWMDEADIRNKDRASTLTLRGYRMPLLVPSVQDSLVDWLVEREVQFLVVDTFARAFSGTENSNEEVGEFLEALDIVKRRAGVPDLVISAHLGRQAHVEGEEHVRGATRLDDWADVRWLMTKDRGHRYFKADGRDVHVDEQRLSYSHPNRRLSVVGGSRKDERVEAGVREAVRVIEGQPGILKGDLKKDMRGDTNDYQAAVAEAVSRGLVRVEHGKRTSQSHYLTERGKEFHEQRFTVTAGPGTEAVG